MTWFINEKRLAMFTWGVYRYKGFPADLNWDMVSVPILLEAPKLGLQGNPRYMYITGTTKHKDQAFQALSALLGDDAQTTLSRSGFGASLNNDAIKKAYGQDVPQLQGKNINAMDNHFRDVMTGAKDINTALREAEEEINKTLDDTARQ